MLFPWGSKFLQEFDFANQQFFIFYRTYFFFAIVKDWFFLVGTDYHNFWEVMFTWLLDLVIEIKAFKLYFLIKLHKIDNWNNM